MTLLTLAAVAALSLTDPTGDAHGDGTLAPPTSPVYAHSAIFDLHEVVVTPSPVAGRNESTLAVTMGAVDLDPLAAGGFKGVVVDVYFDVAPGGSEETLVGPGMLMPAGGGWEYAVRLSPAGAIGVRYQGDQSEPAADSGAVALAPGGGAVDAGLGTDTTPDSGEEPGGPGSPGADPLGAGADDLGAGDLGAGDVRVEPLALSIDGNRLVVPVPLLVDEEAVLYAVSGVYDPFSPTSWRPLSDSASPWAYSGGEQLAPVIDVLAADQEAQTQALTTGVLPRPQRTGDPGTLWLLLMGAGVVLALVGLLLRRRVPAATRLGLPYGLPPEPVAEPGTVPAPPLERGAEADAHERIVPAALAAGPELEAADSDEPEVSEPASDEPDVALPGDDRPGVDQPVDDRPGGDLPPSDLPDIDLPSDDMPDIDLPPSDMPDVDLPPSDMPDVDLPADDLPEIDLPTPQVPDIDLPHPYRPTPDQHELDLRVSEWPAYDQPRPEGPMVGITEAPKHTTRGDEVAADDPFQRFVAHEDEGEEDETGHVGFGGERH